MFGIKAGDKDQTFGITLCMKTEVCVAASAACQESLLHTQGP